MSQTDLELVVKSIDRGPGVKVPPPLIFLFYIVVAYLFNRAAPLPIYWPEYWFVIGGLLIFVGAGVAIVSVYQFWKAKTHIEPWRPATVLIDYGVFAYSRNPVYLAFSIVTLGVGFWLENLLVSLSVLPSALSVYFLVIRKEEQYLETQFGHLYLEYKQKVRRWL